MADNGRRSWPDLSDLEALELPKLSGRRDWDELAYAYATVAAAYHQVLPRFVSALEWLKVHVDAGAVATTIPSPPPARGRMPSVEDLEDAAERGAARAADHFGEILEDVITGTHVISPPPPAFTSDRVRAIAAEEVQRAATAQAAAELAQQKAEGERHAALQLVEHSQTAERRLKLLLVVLPIVVSTIATIVTWYVTRGAVK